MAGAVHDTLWAGKVEPSLLEVVVFSKRQVGWCALGSGVINVFVKSGVTSPHV